MGALVREMDGGRVPEGAPRPRRRLLRSLSRYIVDRSASIEAMRSTTLMVRVDSAAKKRLERLAKSTGRSRSLLAAEAINQYLDVNEWQVAGVEQAIASLDRGEGVPHEQVKDWVVPRAMGATHPEFPPPAAQESARALAYYSAADCRSISGHAKQALRCR